MSAPETAPPDDALEAMAARLLADRGFPARQIPAVAASIAADVRAAPPPSQELLDRLRALFDMSQEVPGRGAA